MGRVASDNLTIVFTDIVNYSELTAAQSRSEAAAMLRRHDQLLLPIVRVYRGRRVKAIGDAMLLTFRSPTDALHCAMAMQDALASARQTDPGYAALRIRVAVNLGEVRITRQDVFGEPVNVAARVEGVTPADEIYFTEAVYLAMNKAEVPCVEVGRQRLKGIADEVRLYRIPPYQAQRLMSVGPSQPDERDLPYAGAHLRRPVSPGAQFLLRAQVSRAQGWAEHVGRRISSGKQQALAKLRQSGLRRVGLAVLGGVLTAGLLLLALPLWQGSGALPDAGPAVSAPVVPSDDAAGAATTVDTLPDRREMLLQAELWLAAGRQADVEALSSKRLQQDPADPLGLVLRGHLAYRDGQRQAGAEDYATALQQEPAWASSVVLSRNLVESLGWISATVRPLIEAHPSAEMLDALAVRTGQTGFHGRSQAADLLRTLGHPQRIDRLNYAIEELRGRTRCEDRLAAVQTLHTLRDPAAIPHLQEALGGTLGSWWANRCLRGAAKEAIATLERLQ